MKKTKKGLIISLSIIAVIFISLLVLPFAFKGKIADLAKTEINNMLTAKVDFEDVSMSFIRNFPNASLTLHNLKITGTNEFENDTLLLSEKINVVINLKSLFSDDGYEIKKIAFDNSSVLLHVLPDGSANWDIMKEDDIEQVPDTSSMSFNLKLNDFIINRADFTYWDEQGNMRFDIKDLKIAASGDLSADSSLLKTQISAGAISFLMDDMEYISKATAEIKADINANLNDFIFTFSENTSRLNAIPFSFSGWVQLLDPEGFDMDIQLNADDVDFKSILSLVPAVYATEFESLKADGKVDLTGYVKGLMVGDDYPAFDLKLSVADGWFQYPDLPKSLQNINIDMQLQNPGGDLDLTVVNIPQFNFSMGGNPFSAQLRVANPMSDPDLKMNAQGKLDLGMIKDIYPLGDDMNLNGIFNINLNLGGRMSYYDNNQFDKFTFGGTMSISDLLLKMASMSNDVAIPAAKMTFNNRYVDLSELKVKIGENDIQATGKLENFVAYALNDKTLKGQLNVTSTYLNLNDFMSDETSEKVVEESTPETPEEAFSVIEVPKNINFTMQADFKELHYGKMKFDNTKGNLKVEDGEVKFQNMSMQAFGGTVLLNGVYSTADLEKPTVNMDLTISDVIFTEIFNQVEMLQKIVPIFSKAKGSFSTKMSFSSLLQQDMTPNLTSILADGSLSTKSIDLSEIPVLDALASSLKKPELSSVSLKDLLLLFSIKDGQLTTKPFDIKVGDLKMNLGGSAGLDQTLSYTGKAQLPDNLNLGRISTIGFTIGGTFKKPSVKLDLAETLNTLLDSDTATGQKVDEIKEKATAEIQKQADNLRTEAKNAGEKLVKEAEKQSNELVNKATNPITKKAAEVAGAKLVEEAKKQADKLYQQADAEATKLEAKTR